jgi:hypothetical protein
MSKAAELAALIGSQTALSNRNLIINGAMQVAQRGTSETGITSSKYAGAPDRFFIGLTTAGTWTAAQSTDAPAGFSSSYKLDCTVADSSLAAGDLLVFQQAIEAQNLQHLKKGTSSAESVTVSFHVKSNKTGTYIAELYDADNTRQISQAYTISSANTWEKKTLTYAGDTTGALNNDNGIGLYLVLWLAAGSSYSSGTLSTSWTTVTNANRAVGVVNLADSTDNEWLITGVQLEVGEQATPFEHRSFADELRRCQRYYETSFDSDPSTTNTSNNGLIASGGIAGDTTTSFSPEASATYKVSKRAVPTVTFYDLATGRNTGKCHRFQLGAQAHDNSDVTIADSGLTRFNAYSGSGNACSGIAFHYEADAEL